MNIQKLKDLAALVDEVGELTIEAPKKDDYFYDKYEISSNRGVYAECGDEKDAKFVIEFTPKVAIELINALEAAERERDELRLEIARIGGATAIEVLRRDAAAGEPVAFTHESEISNMHATGLYIRGFPADRRLNAEEGYTVALYTAAQPAVLPPEKPVVFGSDLCQDIENYGYNLALADTRKLSAQQQKTVTLQGGSLKSDGDIWYRAAAVVELLKSAGVEVKP